MRHPFSPKLFFAFAALLITAFGSNIFGQSGSLDPSFGGSGVVVANLPGSTRASINKIAVQPDGKIVATFDDTDTVNNFRLAIARFNADGSVDSGFGSNGYIYSAWATTAGGPRSFVIRSDGAIVVGGFGPLGRNSTAMRFECFEPAGNPCSSFGMAGVVSVNVGGFTSMTIAPGDKILATSSDGRLVRLNAGDGSLDSTFGSGGIASPKNSIEARNIIVLPSGKIVAVGRIIVAGKSQFTVAGFNSDGSRDDGSKSDSYPADRFASNGQLVITFPGYSSGFGSDIKLDGAGKLVVLGAAGLMNDAVGLARLTDGGQLDSDFGSGGRVVFTDPSGAAQAGPLGIQSDGRIVVIGGLFFPSLKAHDAMLLRFTSAGSLDSFDVGQFVLTDTFGGDEANRGGILYTDPTCSCERVLWAGATYAGGIPTPLMIRYKL